MVLYSVNQRNDGLEVLYYTMEMKRDDIIQDKVLAILEKIL